MHARGERKAEITAVNDICIFKETKYIINTFLIHSLITVFGSLIDNDPREQAVELDGAGSPLGDLLPKSTVR